VRFGEPVSVPEALGPPETAAGQNEQAARLALNKLAFEVSWRINQAAPITGSSLVMLALRGHLLYARRRT